MTSRAITPVFRWLASSTARPAPAGAQTYATTTPGNHAGEAAFLAFAVFSLTATGVIPLTENISPAVLRWLVVAGLLFLLPHLVMGLVSLLLPRMEADPARRTQAQDWGCLAAMTLYAGWRSFDAGWESLVCRIWLGFVLCNLPFLLWKWGTSSRQTTPPAAS
ncbi:MAG: hypothetical protein V4675_14290 [Verrucomicrobiota bacterium]